MNLQTIYLSSLLHDIGKFIERTKKYKDFEFTQTEQKIKYTHPKYGAKWFEIVSPEIPLFKGLYSEELSYIKKIILTHHEPKDLYGKIVQLADWLSSSERVEEEERGDLPYHKQGLKSVFSSVYDFKKDYYYGANPLGFESIFPKESQEVSWAKVEEEFEKNLKLVDDDKKLLTLLELYTWSLPAQTVKYTPDVSLYDHLITTAAFAISLWYEVVNDNLSETSLNGILRDPNKRRGTYFYLLGGDLSGIQSFIFDIPSRGAAKSLKGRSLFLSLLTEAVSEYIIKRLGLKGVNILYIGGGNFQILMPTSLISNLEEIRKEISVILFKSLKDKIYIALEWVPFNLEDIFEKKIPQVFKRLGEKLSERKTKRYTEILNEGIVFTAPEGLLPYEKHCHICGESREDHLYNDEICKMCHSFIELSEEVKNAEYILKTEIDIEKDAPLFTYKDIFKRFGFDISFLEEYRPGAISLFEFLPTGYRLGAYKTPKRSFEEMVEDKKKAKYLAYLKLDVDNLGKLFREGFREGLQSISRRATLSRMLKLFFTAYLPYKYQDREDIYLLYSGGDDTFIIGLWDKIFDLATEIRNEFEKFVGGNSYISFSSGITLFPHHFPIKRAADIVEEELSYAKAIPEKNAISIFSSPLKWEEFEDILYLSDLFVSWAKEENKKAFIHKIQTLSFNFSSLKEDFYNVGKPWQFAYVLRGLKEERRDLILRIVKSIWLWDSKESILSVDIMGKKYHISNPNFLNIAARIAELKLKEVDFNATKQ